MFKIISFSMVENVLGSNLSVSNLQACALFKMVRFGMSGMRCVQNSQCQHGGMLWLKSLVSAWLECIVVKIIRFNMSGMCCGRNRRFQHG
jgi:hypothetical protein